MRLSGLKRQTTVLTIVVTRLMAIAWPEFRDLIRDYPETYYAVDGLILVLLRKLTVRDP